MSLPGHPPQNISGPLEPTEVFRTQDPKELVSELEAGFQTLARTALGRSWVELGQEK